MRSTVLWMLIIGLSCGASARAGVVINEIFADAASVDANCDGQTGGQDDEFVEIVNLGPGVVSLAGDELWDAIGLRHVFPPGTFLAPYDAVVVFTGGQPRLDGTSPVNQPWCAGAPPGVRVQVASTGALSLNNGGDTVELWSGGARLDALAYGGAAGHDRSLVRQPELVGAALVQHPGDPVSPGTLASGGPFQPGPPPDDTAAEPEPGLVLISELLPDAAGADAGFEWIELHNSGGTPVDLRGWTLERATTGAYAARYELPAWWLPPGERVLVGEYLVEEADLVVPVGDVLGLGNAASTADAVRLVTPGGVVSDTVVYGGPNDELLVDDSGDVAISLAPAPTPGASLARVPDGVDTDRSGDDFRVVQHPTPGTPNVDPRDHCTNGAAARGVVVNELDPITTDAEWIELHNARASAVDLSGWLLEHGTQAFGSRLVLPDDLVLAAGDHLLVGDVPGADVVIRVALGNATSNADGLRLLDCVGGVVDTVIYGAPNADGWVDDTGGEAGSLAPRPARGHSLARRRDGLDSDRSGDDFVVAQDPTPGAPNPDLPAMACEPDAGVVMINEILPDPPGADAGLEWVELYNPGPGTVSLGGWAIHAGTRDFERPTFTIPHGVFLPPGTWWVLGGEHVIEADLVADITLGNGTGGDGVRLVDCEGGVVDTVLYGAGASDGLPDDDGLPAEPYGAPGAGQSLGRARDGFDTNVAADWSVWSRPTPGAANAPQGSGGGHVVQGCGRGAAPPGGGGCAAAGGPRGAGAPWPWAWAMLWATARARRSTRFDRPVTRAHARLG